MFNVSVFLSMSLYSECLGSQQMTLAQLCVSDQPASDNVDLVSLLYRPLQQLHQYGRVLLKLAACYDVVRVKHLALFSPFLFNYTFFFHLSFTFFQLSVFPVIE